MKAADKDKCYLSSKLIEITVVVRNKLASRLVGAEC